MKQTSFRAILVALILGLSVAARADVTLAWYPAQGPVITNYALFWGTNSGVYVFEAFSGSGSQTALPVTGLTPGGVYYFAVSAIAADGTESALSSEIVFTNPAASTPPLPPLPTNTVSSTNTATSTNSSSNNNNNNNTSNNSNPTNSLLVTTNINASSEITVQGVPPVLKLQFTNHRPMLTITGTVGATLMVQSCTNPGNLNNWTTITNLPITNAAPNAATNQSSSAVNLAFVPAVQSYTVIDTNPPTCEFYQVVMPYDYMVLADSVLSGQGYPSRLLMVRMPGVSGDDLCYVSPQSSFLFYDSTNRAFAVEPSGSTIRQIATTFSGSLNKNWTSASEFAYSNGVSTILATVVETEDPSTDPVASASTPSIQIDF